MSEQHTPGPWKFEQHGHDHTLWGDGHTGRVLTIRNGVIPMNADARLIAAAPELLEACRRSVRELDACKTEATITGQRRIRNTQTAILAAIAAAVAAPLTFDDDDERLAAARHVAGSTTRENGGATMPIEERITWHPVAERMPGHTHNVLIYMPTELDEVVWIGYHDKQYGWQLANGCPTDEPVTHWADMPTGPTTR